MNAQLPDANSYTPIATPTTNLDAAVPAECRWFRVGDFVTVVGQYTADATAAASTATELQLTLPIPTNLTASGQLSGVAMSNGNVQTVGARISADTTTERASIIWPATTTGNVSWSFLFSYQIFN